MSFDAFEFFDVINSNSDFRNLHVFKMSQIQYSYKLDMFKAIDRIKQSLNSAEQKLKSISGTYLVNTWKRANEERAREKKREQYRNDIKLYKYLLDKALLDELLYFEYCLLNSSVKGVIHSFYLKKYKDGLLISYPQIDYKEKRQWCRDIIIEKQYNLKKANIVNTYMLNLAVDYYSSLISLMDDPAEQLRAKIKSLETEYLMWQRDDIFFTPSAVAEKMVKLAGLNKYSKVLEPNAGIGRIANEIKAVCENVDCIEINYNFAELLRLKGFNVVGTDFLQFNRINYYDAIIMNPPFSSNQDIAHLKHAFAMVKPGGRVVCITSPHWTFSKDNASKSFREWIESENSYTIDLDSGTFEKTNVKTKIVVIEKSETEQQQAV